MPTGLQLVIRHHRWFEYDKANLSSLRRSGRAGDVAAGRAEVAGPRPGHVCAKVCGGRRAGAGWGAGEVSLRESQGLNWINNLTLSHL